MTATKKNRIFDNRKRIRLGIWGLGRGMSFYRACEALNFDVVAGCDYNAHMRDRFLKANPGALATDDADAFLAADFDAVLLATFCPSHAGDAIRALESGKHVLSEVTSFYTMAEGVKLVEAVERTGLVYNLAENYPFGKANMYLREKWREGLFGEFEYGEYEYVHECRSLAYTYIDGTPVQPGWSVHNWRSWLHFHYYNTHSLGPVMHITGLRPARVVALRTGVGLPGYIGGRSMTCTGSIAPSLIQMSNGGLMRNLMGATTNDSHCQRLWGTRGSAEINHGVWLRLGGTGHSPKFRVDPHWPAHGEWAERMGHGGGDFWVLYHFARQILTREPAFFDIYNACDCTIPGILAYRSATEDGVAYEVPDFRDRKQREAWQDDTFGGPRYDTVNGPFPRNADRKLVGTFSTVMKDLLSHMETARAARDWLTVAADMEDPREAVPVLDRFLENVDGMKKTFAAARKLVKAHPRSDGARSIREVLDLAEADTVTRKSFIEKVRKDRARLKRKRGPRAK